MALINCSECGKQFSDRAPACPQCGCPTELARPKAEDKPDGITKDDLVNTTRDAAPYQYVGQPTASTKENDSKEISDTGNSGYLERRAQSQPLLIGFVTGAVIPLTSIVWAVRQRSWSLGILPSAFIAITTLAFNSPLDGERSLSRKYAFQGIAGVIALGISLDQKKKAQRRLGINQFSPTSSASRPKVADIYSKFKEQNMYGAPGQSGLGRVSPTQRRSEEITSSELDKKSRTPKKIQRVNDAAAKIGGIVLGAALMSLVVSQIPGKRSIREGPKVSDLSTTRSPTSPELVEPSAKERPPVTSNSSSGPITPASPSPSTSTSTKCADIVDQLHETKDTSKGISLYNNHKARCAGARFKEEASWHFSSAALEMLDKLYYNKALSYASTAITLNPTEGWAYDVRSTVYSRKREPWNACADAQRAIQNGFAYDRANRDWMKNKCGF